MGIERKMTPDEIKAWDRYVAGLLAWGVNNAVKYADEAILERRKRTDIPPAEQE